MISLCIGTPCYRSDPELAAQWARAMGAALGITEIAASIITHCARIDEARERIVADFVDSGRDALLFRDDDITCAPELISRMIGRMQEGEAIVQADYRKRISNQIVKATDSLGLTLISREVILALHKEYAELTHVIEGREFVGIFDPFYVKTEQGLRKKPEDAAFLHRARSCGYAVSVISPARIEHDGLVSFF